MSAITIMATALQAELARRNIAEIDLTPVSVADCAAILRSVIDSTASVARLYETSKPGQGTTEPVSDIDSVPSCGQENDYRKAPTQTPISDGFVSVELLNTERATADRLRDDNARLRADLATSRELCTKFEAAVGDDVGEMLRLRTQLASYENSQWAPIKKMRAANEELRTQLASARTITDAMCKAAIEAEAHVVDRIQGFSYQSRHVIRDLWNRRGEQEIWSAPVIGPDEYQAFQRQCRIERMRKVLEAALTDDETSQPGPMPRSGRVTDGGCIAPGDASAVDFKGTLPWTAYLDGAGEPQ